jgi:hypothetical protein
LKDQTAAARRSLIRDVIFYTPVFFALLALVVTNVIGIIHEGVGIGVAFLGLLALLALLALYQSVQSLRDLFSTPVITEAAVARKWKGRAEFMVFSGYYLYVNKNVFRIARQLYDEIELEDIVSVTHFRHTATVVALRLVEKRGKRQPKKPKR